MTKLLWILSVNRNSKNVPSPLVSITTFSTTDFILFLGHIPDNHTTIQPGGIQKQSVKLLCWGTLKVIVLIQSRGDEEKMREIPGWTAKNNETSHRQPKRQQSTLVTEGFQTNIQAIC